MPSPHLPAQCAWAHLTSRRHGQEGVPDALQEQAGRHALDGDEQGHVDRTLRVVPLELVLRADVDEGGLALLQWRSKSTDDTQGAG